MNDYLADTEVDSVLREKLIKSRIKSRDGNISLYPVQYKGRVYWNIDHIVNEEKIKASNQTLKKVLTYFVVGSAIYIFGMFHIASYIIGLFM